MSGRGAISQAAEILPRRPPQKQKKLFQRAAIGVKKTGWPEKRRRGENARMPEKASLKILIADDEPLIRKALTAAAKIRGHEAKAAASGREALALWREFDPDLAFVDVFMPEGDGFYLLDSLPKPEAALKRGEAPQTAGRAKVIMISAHDEMSAAELARAGADLFVKKPFEDVFRLIEKGERLAAGPAFDSL